MSRTTIQGTGKIRYRKGFLNEDFDDKGVLKPGAKRFIDIFIEYLPCGHSNNLKLANRESGVCPKGCVNPVQVAEEPKEEPL